MKPIRQMSQSELAAFIQSHLRASGVNVILSGGACVSIYSGDRYVSLDLDFVNAFFAKRERIRSLMEEIGFKEEGRHFIHPDTQYFVEFPPGPLAVGTEPVRQVNELKLATGILGLLSPTDCVKDRLLAYYHWDDEQCLHQAGLVAESSEFDIEEIERWSEAEGMRSKFERIKDHLSAAAR